MDADRVAQPPGGPSESFLATQAKALEPLDPRVDPRVGRALPRNMALLVSPKGAVTRGTRRSTRSPSPASTSTTPPGDRVVTADVDGVRVTPFVCYDLRFPEPFRLAAAETGPLRRRRQLAGGAPRALAHPPARPRDREPGLRRRRQPRRRRRRPPLRRRLRPSSRLSARPSSKAASGNGVLLGDGRSEASRKLARPLSRSWTIAGPTPTRR